VINFADENPTASRKAWRAFLEALIAENVDLILVGSTRAGDIVRDADILHLHPALRHACGRTADAISQRANAALDGRRPRPLSERKCLSVTMYQFITVIYHSGLQQ
jgi:anaerobic magnesium-protoporphyrin IX monomethyl ester cyclase